ncbi:MAG: peptidase MA family metallohydrolase [Gemmatimonadota bacterium]|nr:peptidase MA family metallohydrolase [Gemmatimonadota bacterium]
MGRCPPIRSRRLRLVSLVSLVSLSLGLTVVLGAGGRAETFASPPGGQEVPDTGGPAAGQRPVPRAPDGARPVPDTLDGEAYASLLGARAVVYHTESQSLVAARVSALLDSQTPLPGLPDSLPFGVHAVLAHSPAAFDEVTGGVVPEWRAGVAVPSLNMLVMPTGERVLVFQGEGLRTLRHEWAHLGLHQFMGDLRIPRWFNEGYAQWASGGFDATGAWRLRVLIARGNAPPMDSLTLGWPAGREDARTAYLLAASAITYVLESGGERGLELFLERWRAGRSFEAAFRQTFGVTTGQFEEDWKRHVRSRYGWLFVLSHSAVFWLLLALVLLLMARGRQGRNREKLARLRAGEIPDAPAFWETVDGRPEGRATEPIHPPTWTDGPEGSSKGIEE